tara:strand:+ start:283 stop:933 length:651 start_codon:yes stop_codon:yes gene_type:complete
MNSKTLSSWMLIVAPVLFVLMLFVVWPAVIGEGKTAAEDVTNLRENRTAVSILLIVGTIIFASMSIGYTLLSWARADGSTREGTLASIASIIFVGITTMVFIMMGTTFPVIGTPAEKMIGDRLIEAQWVMVLSDSMFPSIMLAWAFGNVVLGSALLLENKINKIASGFLLAVGILMVIMHLLAGVEDKPAVMFMVPMLLSAISPIVLGIFNLRSES